PAPSSIFSAAEAPGRRGRPCPSGHICYVLPAPTEQGYIVMAERIRIGIAGHGNLGRGVEAAVAKNPDMTLAGIYTRRAPESLVPRDAATPVHAMALLPEHRDRIDVLIL